MLVQRSFYVDADDWTTLQEYAASQNISVAQVVRKLMARYARRLREQAED